MGEFHDRPGDRAEDRAIHASEGLEDIAYRRSNHITGDGRPTCLNRTVRYVGAAAAGESGRERGVGHKAGPAPNAAPRRRCACQEELLGIWSSQNGSLVF